MTVNNLASSDMAGELSDLATKHIGAFEKVMHIVSRTALSREQVAVVLAGIGGAVSLYAIKNKYSFSLDLQAKKISFAAPE